MRDPVSSKSRAAGTKYPASSQKYGRRSNGPCSRKRQVKISEKARSWSRIALQISAGDSLLAVWDDKEAPGGRRARDPESRPPMDLMNGSAHGMHARIQLDLAEGGLVVRQVLLQDGVQRLGLLRAQIDALKIADFDLGFVLLLQGAEHQEEVPDIDPHLNAVGVVLAVVGGVRQLYR